MDTKAAAAAGITLVAGLIGGYGLGKLGNVKLPAVHLDAPVIEGIYTLPENAKYTITCVNFPPNVQLIAPQSLYPPAIVNMGVTDSKGTLVIHDNIARGPPADYYLIVWNASDGRYCALASLKVISALSRSARFNTLDRSVPSLPLQVIEGIKET